MIDADALHEAEQQALGQLGQMDLSLAKHLHGLALSSEDTQEIVEFARAYQRASRCAQRPGAAQPPPAPIRGSP